jgi:hypothetical protein
VCITRRVAIAIWVGAGLLWITASIVLTRTVDHHAPVPVATVIAVFAGTTTIMGCHVWGWGILRDAQTAQSVDESTVAIVRRSAPAAPGSRFAPWAPGGVAVAHVYESAAVAPGPRPVLEGDARVAEIIEIGRRIERGRPTPPSESRS